jgi:hypothetical protein
MTRQEVYALIDAERDAQDRQWGEAYDDRNTPTEWCALMCRSLGLAFDEGRGHDPKRFRKQLVRVAALCVAALESQARKEPPAPRAIDHRDMGSGF